MKLLNNSGSDYPTKLLDAKEVHKNLRKAHFFLSLVTDSNTVSTMLKTLSYVQQNRYEEITLKVRDGQVTECTGKETLILDKNARISEYVKGDKMDLTIKVRKNGAFADRYVTL